MKYCVNWFQLLRVRQWVKNIFVLLPLFFSGKIMEIGNPQVFLLAIYGFGAFCFWSSVVYILNDWTDCQRDREHPRKKNRPLASGAISPGQAFAAAILLFLLPLGIAVGWLVGLNDEKFIQSLGYFLACGLGYLANNLLYCFLLRFHVLLDVFSIAVGFVLRVLAGCFILGVEPSQWILVCTFTLALFLGFGKRRQELALCDGKDLYRSTLNHYSIEFLNFLMSISAAICLMAYMLYTIAPGTIAQHNSDDLIYTTPFVFYGIFRYMLFALRNRADGPDEVLFRDIPFLVNGILWLGVVLWLI